MENRINVLVIDDKKVIRDFFDITLGYYGHNITVLHDPMDVASVLDGKEYDIAFVDMMMPEKDGVEVLKELKSARPQMPVVMMSGYSLEEKRRQALDLGACGCLKKPFEVEDLRTIIREMTGKTI